jgi:hypothetical protein
MSIARKTKAMNHGTESREIIVSTQKILDKSVGLLFNDTH